MSDRVYDERDYIDRTIQTARNHRDADNCWPQWANQFADEIERLRAVNADSERVRRQLAEALRYFETVAGWHRVNWAGAEHQRHALTQALAASDALDQKEEA